jgi:hypothetical protein
MERLATSLFNSIIIVANESSCVPATEPSLHNYHQNCGVYTAWNDAYERVLATKADAAIKALPNTTSLQNSDYSSSFVISAEDSDERAKWFRTTSEQKQMECDRATLMIAAADANLAFANATSSFAILDQKRFQITIALVTKSSKAAAKSCEYDTESDDDERDDYDDADEKAVKIFEIDAKKRLGDANALVDKSEALLGKSKQNRENMEVVLKQLQTDFESAKLSEANAQQNVADAKASLVLTEAFVNSVVEYRQKYMVLRRSHATHLCSVASTWCAERTLDHAKKADEARRILSVVAPASEASPILAAAAAAAESAQVSLNFFLGHQPSLESCKESVDLLLRDENDAYTKRMIDTEDCAVAKKRCLGF